MHCETLPMACEECDVDAGQLRALALNGFYAAEWLEHAFGLASMNQGLTYLEFKQSSIPLSLLGKCASVKALSYIRSALACTSLQPL
jgi:hypothetical protein